MVAVTLLSLPRSRKSRFSSASLTAWKDSRDPLAKLFVASATATWVRWHAARVRATLCERAVTSNAVVSEEDGFSIDNPSDLDCEPAILRRTLAWGPQASTPTAFCRHNFFLLHRTP